MSTESSDRARGGVADLRAAMLGWLEDHGPLTARLEMIDSVDDAGDVIRPHQELRRGLRADGDLPDIVLTVMVFTGNTGRDNLRTEKDHSGQVMLSLRESATIGDSKPAGQWSDQVRDELVTVLTRNREGWLTPSVPGGDSELAWNDQTNREELAITYDITSRV